jgi:hypothetical protein
MRISTSFTSRSSLGRSLSTAPNDNDKQDAPVEPPVDAPEPIAATPEKAGTGDKGGAKEEKKEKTELEKLKDEKEDLIVSPRPCLSNPNADAMPCFSHG